MGMFDYIIIDSKKLPVFPSERELLKNKIFQTKDLEKCLLSYEITNDGEIMLQNIKDEKTSELIPYFREMDDKEFVENKNIICKNIPFRGFIRFYTLLNKSWYEFKAKFTDGKLVSIEKIFKND
jgi:hypothetical protein